MFIVANYQSFRKTGIKAHHSPGRSLSGGCVCSDLKEKAQLHGKPGDFIIHQTQLTNMKDL